MNEPAHNNCADQNLEISTGNCTFDRIGQLYLEYVEICRTQRPDLAEFVARVSPDQQAPLLRNLLEFEIPYRRGNGESPVASEYLSRLPVELSDVVRLVFLEGSTWLGSQVDSTQSNVESLQQSGKSHFPAAATRLGDYRLIRELGRGGMGAVYEAVHLQRGHRVALKTLPTVSGDSLHRFKREFRTLAEVTHPNLVGLRTLESDGSQWFITLDLLTGIDFLQYVRPHGQFDQHRLRNAFAQLCSGVMALHSRGVVHRDLKPSNVMVLGDGRVVILDFGLVAEFDRFGLRTDTLNVAGTPSYMAPEQASGGAIGPAADWYAVGVMLYEGLSGRRPFLGPVVQVLKEKCSRDPDPLPESLQLPVDLVQLCCRLMSRNPEDRPGSLEIADVVSLTEVVSREQCSLEKLIGRDQQLTALHVLYQEFRQDRSPAFASVTGRSGEGKSSLLESFLKSLPAGPELVVISGRCYDRESVPFKALDSVIDALTSHLRSLPETDAALLLPDDIGMLVELFPVLRRCDVIARAPRPRLDALDQQQVRQRAFTALRLLLDRLSGQTPIVCFIDDVQWGDSDSAAALFEVLRPPFAPQVLMLVSFRSDEAAGSPFLREWENRQRQNGIELSHHRIEVGPLSLEDATQLLMQQFNRDDAAVQKRAMLFHVQTGGNPFLLTELAACYDPDSDTLQSMDINGVLDRKLSILPMEAGPLLDVVAVSGQALSLDEAVEVAGVSEAAEDVLTRLRNSRLLRVIGDKVDTYHDRIRYAVLDRIPEEKNRLLHLSLACCIERVCGETGSPSDAVLDRSTGTDELTVAASRIYDLAYHFDSAGEQQKALKYSAIAANQAKSQYALDVAVQQYSIAQRNSSSASNDVKFQLSRGKAEVLLQLGRYPESQAELDSALVLANTDYDFADVRGLMGELASKQGRIGASIEHYEAGIGRLGIRVPVTAAGFLWGIAHQSLRQSWHSLFPSRIRRQNPTREEHLVSHLLGRIDWSYYCNNFVKLVWASLVGMNRAECAPASRALIVNYVVHANDMAVLGWHSRATRYYEAARTVSQKLNDQWGMALASNHTSFGCVSHGRFRDSLQYSLPVVEAFKRLGDLWELHLTYMNLCTAYFRLGDFRNALHYGRILIDQCIRTGDNYMSPASLFYVSRFSRGSVPFEELRGCIAVEAGNHLGMSLVHLAEGYWHAHHGRTEEALGSFEAAWSIAITNRCLMPPNANVLNDLVKALRGHAEATADNHPALAQQIRARWKKMVPWMVRLSLLFPAERPEALREAARYAEYRGDLRKALKLCDMSCELATRQEAAYELCLSRLVRAEIALKLQLSDSRNEMAAAQSELERFQIEIAECIPR